MDPDHGRMGVILPQGVLFKKEFKDMRRKMLESNKLEAVVQLAGNLFYGTQLAPCILFLRNNKENERIRFVDASGIFKKGRAQNFLLDEHVESIIEALVSDRDIDGISKTVSLNDLDQDSVEINVSKYVVKEFVDDTPPYEEVIRSLMDNIERSKGLEARIKSMIEEGGFLDE